MLNLLPPEIKSRHKVKSQIYSITVFYIIIAGIFTLGPLAAITYNFIQSEQVSNIESEISQIKSQIGKSQTINNKLSFVENRVSVAGQFKEDKDWIDYLEIISASTPAPVTVSVIRLEEKSETGPAFTVTGKSIDRRSIVLYRDKLLENEKINQATFTALTETVEASGKTFSFTVSIIFIA